MLAGTIRLRVDGERRSGGDHLRGWQSIASPLRSLIGSSLSIWIDWDPSVPSSAAEWTWGVLFVAAVGSCVPRVVPPRHALLR